MNPQRHVLLVYLVGFHRALGARWLRDTASLYAFSSVSIIRCLCKAALGHLSVFLGVRSDGKQFQENEPGEPQCDKPDTYKPTKSPCQQASQRSSPMNSWLCVCRGCMATLQGRQSADSKRKHGIGVMGHSKHHPVLKQALVSKLETRLSHRHHHLSHHHRVVSKISECISID